MVELIEALNQLTWPGALALVAIVFACAAVAVRIFW